MEKGHPKKKGKQERGFCSAPWKEDFLFYICTCLIALSHTSETQQRGGTTAGTVVGDESQSSTRLH